MIMPNSLRCKIKHLCHNGTLTEREQDRILKALEQEPKWIPVSERLPEDNGRYLVSVLDGIDHRTAVVPYHPQSRTWTLTGRMAYWKVMAWMPLPEPYKAKSEEDNAKSEVEVCSRNFIQLKQDVLNNNQLWRKLREIEDEDSD